MTEIFVRGESLGLICYNYKKRLKIEMNFIYVTILQKGVYFLFLLR